MLIRRSYVAIWLGVGVAIVACKSNNISETTVGSEASTCAPIAGLGQGSLTSPSGRWQGMPLPTGDVVAFYTAESGGTVYGSELDLLLTSYQLGCGWIGAALYEPGTAQVQIALKYASTNPPAPTLMGGGTPYMNGAADVAIEVGGYIAGSTCSQTGTEVALAPVKSGTITLAVFAPPDQIEGSFDVTTAVGEHLTGSFQTAKCDAHSGTSVSCCTQ